MENKSSVHMLVETLKSCTTLYKGIFNKPLLIFCYYYWNESTHFKSLKHLRITQYENFRIWNFVSKKLLTSNTYLGRLHIDSESFIKKLYWWICEIS